MNTNIQHETEQKQQKYYNSIADVYDQHYHNTHALKYRFSIYKRILKGIDFSGSRVLDAMCGGGENTGFFTKIAQKVEGLDLSQRQCEIYEERYPDLEVKCASVTSTGYPDESFDFIVTDSLHHTHPYVDETVRELWRILKPNGRLLIWEPSAGSIMNLARKLWYSLDRSYFEENEKAISLKSLSSKHSALFDLEKQNYGGNLAYLLVQESMVFRVPPKFIKYYANPLISVDAFFEKFQTELTSCWVLGLLRKK